MCESKEHLQEVNSLSSSTYMSLRNSAQVLRLGNKSLQLLSNLASTQFEKDLFTYLLCVPVQVCTEARRGCLLSSSISTYFFEAGSLTEPGARDLSAKLEASKPQ